MKADIYLDATTLDIDDTCNSGNLSGETTTLFPTGCFDYTDGTSEMIECSTDDVTITYYDDIDCTGSVLNETSIMIDECDDGFIYSIVECDGSGGGGSDGSSDTIQIAFGTVFVFIGLIQLLQ